MSDSPELQFQQHICDELLKRYKGDTLKYTALEQSEITDQENFIAEDVLWAFVTASQPEEVGRVGGRFVRRAFSSGGRGDFLVLPALGSHVF